MDFVRGTMDGPQSVVRSMTSLSPLGPSVIGTRLNARQRRRPVYVVPMERLLEDL